MLIDDHSLTAAVNDLSDFNYSILRIMCLHVCAQGKCTNIKLHDVIAEPRNKMDARNLSIILAYLLPVPAELIHRPTLIEADNEEDLS